MFSGYIQAGVPQPIYERTPENSRLVVSLFFSLKETGVDIARLSDDFPVVILGLVIIPYPPHQKRSRWMKETRPARYYDA